MGQILVMGLLLQLLELDYQQNNIIIKAGDRFIIKADPVDLKVMMNEYTIRFIRDIIVANITVRICTHMNLLLFLIRRAHRCLKLLKYLIKLINAWAFFAYKIITACFFSLLAVKIKG